MEVFKIIFDYGLPLNHQLITQAEFNEFTLILGIIWGIVILCLFLPFITKSRNKAVNLFLKEYPNEKIKTLIKDKKIFMYWGIIIPSAFGGAFILPSFLFDSISSYDNSIPINLLIFWGPAYLFMLFFLLTRYSIVGVLSDRRITFVAPHKLFCNIFFKEMLNLPLEDIQNIEFYKEMFLFDVIKIVNKDNKKISLRFFTNLKNAYYYINTVIRERSL